MTVATPPEPGGQPPGKPGKRKPGARSLLEQWLAQESGPDPQALSKTTIRRLDRYDRQDLGRISKEMKDFRVGRDELCEVSDTGAHLWDDSFFAFYKVDPAMHDKGEMRPEYLLNWQVQKEFRQLPEYERLRAWTEGDIVSSAAAVTTMADDLASLADRAKKHQEEAEQVMRQYQEWAAAQQGLRGFDEMVQDWKDIEPTEEEKAASEARAEELADMRQQAQDEVNEMQAALDAAASDLDEAMQGEMAGSMASIRKALADAANDAEEMTTAARGWGLDPGELRKMDATARLKLSERLRTPKFKRIAELWGPMSRIAFAEQQRKIYHSNEEVYDVSTGNDLGRLLPSELASLANPTLKLDFYRRYTEEKLLQYEMRGTEKVGKGGIIFCMDNSGSMSGEPECWAKAVGLCTLHIAREQKRSFYGLHFSSRHQVEAFDFRKPEDITIDRVLAYAENFFGGGTVFEDPLNHARAILKEEFDEKGFVEGDIVFCTDGMAPVNPEWLKAFKRDQEEMGFKVWGILIGGYRESEPLWTICDHNVVTISDLLSGDEVREMFREL